MKKTKITAIALALTVVVGGSPLGYLQNVNAADNKRPVMPLVKREIPVESDYDDFAEQGASLPSKYDPRVTGKVSAVRDQGEYGSCWAFAAIAAMESNLIKKGIANKNVDLSENQVLYFFYNKKNDPLGNLKGDKNKPLLSDWLNTGGIGYELGLSAMTWSGITTEKKSVYPSTPSNSLAYAHDYVVKNMHRYKYNIKDLKKAIKQYGAVSIGMYYDTNYVNEYTGAAYCPQNYGQNHEVTLVGWDDSYSRYNFGYTPKADGAWIVKNSYGKNLGDQGYYYISYYDGSIDDAVAYDMVKKSASYDNNYQYDGTASQYFYTVQKGDSVSNVFTAKAKKGRKEKLKAISICTYTDNTKYSIQVYTNLKKKNNPESGKKLFGKPQTGKISDAGYVTIPLKKGATLKYGQTYAVVVKILSTSKIGIERSDKSSWIEYKVGVSKKQGFLKYSGKWYDLGSNFGANIRIKAYTDTM